MSDQSYTDASVEAMGRTFAMLFAALIAGGMTRYEALEVVKAWVAAAALKPQEQS